MANTLYDVLEVIPTASAETIQAAYRSLIMRYHPDKVAMLGPDLQAVANARTRDINFAYDILSDAASRARYDEELRGGDDDESPSLLPKGPVVDNPVTAFQGSGFDTSPEFYSQDEHGPGAQGATSRGAAPRGPEGSGKRPRRPAGSSDRHAAAAAAGGPPQARHPLAVLASAMAGIALVLTLPPASNLVFGAVEFSLTGHARFFYDAENPVDAKGNFGAAYLPVLWGWLFANYLFGLISYRLAVLAGEVTAARFGGSFAGTNDRLFLFLTFVCVVAVGELFFSAHTMGNMLADMFILAGAYLAERGIS